MLANKILYNKLNIRYFLHLFLFVLICGCSKQTPIIQDGAMDLTNWDFYQDGPVCLNGQWEFYHRQLLKPIDFDTADIQPQINYQKVPSIWKGATSNGKKLSGFGYATYHILIKHKKFNNEIFAIKMGETYTAYRIWANGKELLPVGTVGTDKSSSKPQFKTQVIPVVIDTDQTEIVLQVSNFHYKDGGVKEPIIFGLESHLTASRERSLVLSFLVFGCILVMGVYHLILTFLNKEKLTTLLFAIFCLLVASRELVLSSYYIVYLFPNFNWQVHHRLIVLTYYLATLVFLGYIYRLFTNEFSLFIVKTTFYIGVLLSIIVLATPVSFYSRTEIFFQLMILLGIIYVFFVVIKAIKNKRHGAVLLLIGLTIIFIVAINDILNSQYLSPYQNLLPLGLLAFIIIQSYILAKHFSDAVVLSEELAILNVKLQKSNETKDKFFSIVAHDLRGPIGNLANLLNMVDLKRMNPKIYTNLQETATNTNKLVQDLLTWSRAQKHQIAIETTNFNMSRLCSKVVSILKDSAQQKLIQLIVMEDNKDVYAFADIPTVETIIRNLVSNAIKFTHKGGKITLSITSNSENVKIFVADTGIGMSNEIKSNLFKIGAQTTSQGTNEETGTGLGLLLCKEFVVLNKGKIGVESEKGKGTTFWFKLPRGKVLN